MSGRRWTRTTAAATLVAVAAAAVWTFAGDADEEDDALTALDDAEGQGVAARCVVADPEGELILHPGSFTADEPTRLVALTLEEPENLEVVEEVVASYRGPEDLHGVLDEYPPSSVSYLEGLADWETRRPLPGLRVGPRDRAQVVLVAVRLADLESPGHLRGVTVRARTAAGPRTRGWEQLVLVLPAGETCTPEAIAETTEWTG